MRTIKTSHYLVKIPKEIAARAEPIMKRRGILKFPDFVRQAVADCIYSDEAKVPHVKQEAGK